MGFLGASTLEIIMKVFQKAIALLEQNIFQCDPSESEEMWENRASTPKITKSSWPLRPVIFYIFGLMIRTSFCNMV